MVGRCGTGTGNIMQMQCIAHPEEPEEEQEMRGRLTKQSITTVVIPSNRRLSGLLLGGVSAVI